jgi:hypothetical protein
VARFVPERLGKMMIAYVAWLLPFEEFLYAKTDVSGPPRSMVSSMWKSGRKGQWETPQLSESLSALTGEHVKVELTVSSYRHVAIGLGRMIKEIVIRQVEMEMGEQEDDEEGMGDVMTEEHRDGIRMEYVWDLQATHGSMIARRHYALDVRYPSQLQPEMLVHFREISRLWHQFLTGQRRRIRVEPEQIRRQMSGQVQMQVDERMEQMMQMQQ